MYSPPQDKPSLPSGWIPQWDSHYQRWYYAEEATGRTQWEAPGARNSGNRGWGGSHGGEAGHGAYDAYGGHQGSGHDSYDHGHDSHGYDDRGSSSHDYHGEYHDDGHKKDKNDKKKDHTLLYAAGGLAVGAVGGALIAQALGTSLHATFSPSFQ